ncbi:MAG: hypothetical protein AAF394_03110 [Planctomycetota bacterium]
MSWTEFRSLASVCILIALCPVPLLANDDEEQVADGPWISSVVWDGEQSVVGTNPQGLLLRPAKLVRAAASGEGELETLGESETSLWSVLSLSDGRWLSSDYKGGLHLMGKDAGKIECEARWVRALAATPEDGKVLAGTEDGKVLLLSVADKKELSRVDAHKAAVFDIAFNASGDKVATAGGDGVIKIHSWPELKPIAEMNHGSDAVWSVAFVEGDSKLVSGGAGRRLQLWDLESAQSICTLTRTRDWITDLIALPDSDVVMAFCMDGKVIAADTQVMTKVAEKELAGSAIWSASLNGKRIALGTRKHGVIVADVPDCSDKVAAAKAEMEQLKPPSPK